MATIQNKLQKLLTLSKSGVGGEKENATKLLNSICEKYGITLESLSDSEKVNAEFKYKSKQDKRLICQIIGKVLNTSQLEYYIRRKNKTILMRLTLADKVEVEDMIEHYRKEWKKKQEIAFAAFIQANSLFGNSNPDDKDKKPMTPEEWERISEMFKMTAGMKAASHNKKLEENSDE